MKRKHVLLLFLVIGLMGSAAAQSVQVDGLDFEEVNESFDSEGMDFQVYNDSVSLTAKQVFVPDELSDKASFSQYNFVEAPEGDVIQWTGYTFDTGVDYGSPELNDLLAWGEGGGVDAGSKYPANFFNTGAVSEISRGNDTSEVFDTFVVDKNQGYNVSINVQASSHYEHLVMDYELVYSNESTTEVVAEFQDVYSGSEPEKLPVSSSILKYDRDGVYQDRVTIQNDRMYEYSKKDVQVVVLNDKSQNFTGLKSYSVNKITEIDSSGMYDKVENEAETVNATSSLVNNISDYQVHAYNMTLESNTTNIIQAFQKSSEGVEGNMSIYILGSFAGGSGTSNDPYEIETCSQLQDISNDISASYKLISNVDCSGNEQDSIGDYDSRFSGVLDGNGYIVDSFSEDSRDQSNGISALFGAVGGSGVVKNIGFTNVDMDGAAQAAGLAGYNFGTVKNSYSTGSVDAHDTYPESGGLITINDGSVSNTYSSATVNSNDAGGGLIAENDDGTVSTSFSYGNVNGLEGFIFDEYIGGPYTDNYFDKEATGDDSSLGATALTTSQITYPNAKSNLNGFDFSNTWVRDSNNQNNGYPYLEVFCGKQFSCNSPPSASFTTNSPVKTSEDFGLDASGSSDPDGDSLTYEWDLSGDGNYDDATGATPSNSEPDNGDYTVGLKVSDGNGGTDTASNTVTVENRDPSASFTTSTSDKVLDVDGTGSSDQDGSISSYEWDWANDGTFEDTGSTASNTYSSGGSYTVGLRVTDDDGATTTTTQTVDINDDPVASITSDTPVLTSNDFGLDASGSTDTEDTSLNYDWDLTNDGDFDDSTGATPSYSEPDDGDYPVEVRVTDSEGATDTASTTVTVDNREPSADFSFTRDDKVLDVDATTSSDLDGSISSYEWDWTNDGNYEALGSTSSKTFSSGGTYSVELRTTDDDGATDTITENVDINDDPSLDSTSFTSTDVEQGDSTSLEASVSDTDGSVSDVTFTATVGGDTVYSGSSGTDLGGGVFESPSVTADCANCDIEITVDSVTDDDGATVTPGQMGSLTVPNTAPSITNQRFNDTSPDYEDEIVFRTDVSDKEYSVSEVRVTVWENGSKIVDNQTASNTAGSTWEGPSFTVDEVETEYKASTSYAVDSQGLSSDASSEGATYPSISTGNSPPTINDMSFNDSNPDYGEKVRFEADITDSEVGINDSSLQLQVFEGDNKILDTSGSFENGKYVTEGFRPTNIDESYTAEVGFVEDLEGFSTDSSNQGVTVPSISVDAVRPESVNDVNVTGFNSSARSTQVLGENVTTDVDYSIQNSRSYGVDVNLSDEVGQACTLDSNGLGTVSSGSTGEVSEVLNCEVGSTSEAFLDVVTGEPTANYNTVNYSTEITIPSNYTENDDVVWEINDSNLRDWGSREFGTEELIIPSDNSTEVNYVSSSDTVKASILNEESLSEGVYDATLSYYYAQESDSDSGGGGGGTTIIEDDEDDSDNETTIQIEDPNKDFRQRRGLIEPGLEYGSTTEKEFKISNVVPETNQLEVKVPDDGNRFCSYIQVEETLGSDTYSDRGVYNLPSNSDTGTRYANIRYSMPERQVLEAEGVTDYSCSLETSASIGSSDPLDIEAGFDSSALDQLGFSFEGFEVWGKEYCIGGETMEATVNSSQEFSEDGSCSGDTVEGPTGLGAGVIALVLLTSVAAVFYRD